MPEPLLSVQSLETQFFTDDGRVKAVDQVSFDIAPREILGVVGESGSGKSVTSLSVLRLVSSPGKITGGQILWKGRDLLKLSEREMRAIRGDDIAMIFQEPMTSLNPLFTVGNHIQEALLLHQGLKGQAARTRAIAALEEVGIRDASSRIDAYPHQLSGGMRQRVMIAIALSCNPDLLIADEPTTALDVTVQAKILDLMRGLRDEKQMAILLITHNMGIVAEMCDRVAVMHRGKIVEMAGINEIFASPRHPYTQQLLKSIPTLDSAPKTKLATVSWHPTPEQAANAALVEVGAGHSVSAWAV
ncbi:peptide/nickel transport system ATP-binding protein [Abditibacterium utsteinense]|uniref:Peptide/nickel transport system ATP-binding protein n=1 Tax=Abditibacterium utsteinense TaxID=1960156 RepID=A0A2S8SX13_9BACT|nr:ABC transporter ATP-binding protein [Abditibacterium utsteinense]PQV65343.1 peptide/nickel transport system ATP-binding protein [Abditibacterium utsteinense]